MSSRIIHYHRRTVFSYIVLVFAFLIFILRPIVVEVDVHLRHVGQLLLLLLLLLPPMSSLPSSPLHAVLTPRSIGDVGSLMFLSFSSCRPLHVGQLVWSSPFLCLCLIFAVALVLQHVCFFLLLTVAFLLHPCLRLHLVEQLLDLFPAPRDLATKH